MFEVDKMCYNLQLSTVLMRLFGYPYNNDLVICKVSKDSPDYLCNQQDSVTNMIAVGILKQNSRKGEHIPLVKGHQYGKWQTK